MGKLNVFLFIFTAFIISACNNDNNNPAPTGSNEIVYNEFINDSTIQIVAQNIDGSNKRILVGSGLNFLSSQVYANKFVYSTNSLDGEYSKISLYDLNANTNTKIIEDNTGRFLFLCSLSPTLDKIAFNDDGHPRVVNIDGTNYRTYTNYDIYESQPVFTTDGKNIVFATQNTDACIFNGKYYSLNLLSNTAISLGLDSYPTAVNDDALRISTNSNKILYNYNYYECGSGGIINRTSTLSTIEENGSNNQIIKTESGDGNFYQSVWSNDGSKIASLFENNIVIMDANGIGLVNLTNATNEEEYYEPQWSPDDSKIVATRFYNDEQFLITIDVATKEKRTIVSSSFPDIEEFYYRAFWIK